MSEQLRESLSAAMDGEADEFELLRVLDETGKDPQLAESWERYHLIGSIMRRETVTIDLGMRERIWASVTPEEAYPVITEVSEASAAGAPAMNGPSRWVPAAVAATVVIAAVVGFVGFPGVEETDVPRVTATDNVDIAPADIAQANITQPILATSAVLSSEVTHSDQIRTEAYVMRHHQQRGMVQSGIGGFAKMVSYQRN